jgi:glycosyltransferase involved in cell wall biosynthesis
MKIVMITPFPPDPRCIVGGVAGVSVYLTQALLKIPGLDVEVVVPNAPLPQPQTCDFDRLRVHYLPFAGNQGYIRRSLWGTNRLIREKLSELSFDLVHVQGVAAWTRDLKCPYVLTIHGIAERDALFLDRPFRRVRSFGIKLVEQRDRRRAPDIIIINPYVRDFLGRSLRHRTWDIPNPVADGFFNVVRQPIPGRVLYGGHITVRKNILGLIRGFSFAALKRPDAHLHLAGEGLDKEYSQQCRNLVRELGLEDKVRFLGGLGVETLRDEMTRASCLALCSFQETAPLIIAEAMACGLPVVASNICGIPYMVRDNETGKLVRPEDPADIARGIVNVLESENVAGMSLAARQIAKKEYYAPIVAQKTYQVYKTILGQ